MNLFSGESIANYADCKIFVLLFLFEDTKSLPGEAIGAQQRRFCCDRNKTKGYLHTKFFWPRESLNQSILAFFTEALRDTI